MIRPRGCVAAVAAVALGGALAPASAQDWKTLSVSRTISGESNLEVDLRHGAGTLRVEPVDGPLLYAMDLRYDAASFEPLVEYDGGRVVLGIEGPKRDLRLGRNDPSAEMDVRLSTRVPTQLALTFGAGRADVDLGGLRLTALSIETGASETRLDVSRPNPGVLEDARIAVGAAHFTARRLGNLGARHVTVDVGVGQVVLDLSGEWLRDLDMDVHLGLGALELRVPRGLGVKLVKKAFLTALDAPEMRRDGDAWYSSDWSTAERRIAVDVDTSFGAVEVVWLP